MITQPQMFDAFTKQYHGFTLSVLHDSANCIRCMQIYTFYNKLKNKELCLENETINVNSKYKLFGLVTYLDNCLHVEVVTPQSLENQIPIPRAKAKKSIQNVPCKKKKINNQQNNSNKKSHKRANAKKKKLKTKQSTKKNSRENSLSFRANKSAVKKTVQSNSACNQPRGVQSKVVSGRTDQPQKKAKKSNDAKQLKQTKSPSKKCDNDMKVPGKGTLKRKRWYLDKLKTDEDYEDDIFDDQECCTLETIVDDDESEPHDNMSTPTLRFSFSPRERSISPTYEDCYSPSELSIIRKDAEEYQYRRYKRRKSMMTGLHMDDASVTSQKSVKKECPDTTKVLEDVCKYLITQPKNEKDSESGSEDSYFSDASCDQFQKFHMDT